MNPADQTTRAARPLAAAEPAQLLQRLQAVLPADAIHTAIEARRPYECDGLTACRSLPLLVVLPASADEVAAVLRICHELKVPVVPRGAATGLSGGAMPHAEGVLLSLARLNRILAIDPLARTARVQPGVRNLAVSEAAAPYGLYYAPDPSSQIACTIGGNVAENSGGVHCLKYGLTVHNLLAVRGFAADGAAIELGGAALDAPGFDLLALITGSEGLLAVITEVTLKLIPKPQQAQVLLAYFDDVNKAGAAVAAVIAAGIIPGGLEMMDKAATHAVEPYVRAGYDLAAEAVLLCEADGTPEEVAEEMAHMQEILAASGATSLVVSNSESERLLFWAGRKAAFPAVGRITPDYLCMDGSIPRRHLAQMLAAIADLEKKYALRCANVFHAGDGNLHPLIMYDANQPGELDRAQAFGAAILELSVRLGGSITGEHGVGVEKIDLMALQFSADEIAALHRVKAAFDPDRLLNPGKAVPTLARCREYLQTRAPAPQGEG